MNTYTIDNLNELITKFKHLDRCNETQNALYEEIYGSEKVSKNLLDHWWDEHAENMDIHLYANYIIDSLIDELNKHDICFVTLSNNYRCGVNFGHHFTLFKIDNLIYRIDSYMSIIYDNGKKDDPLYNTRLTKYVDFVEDMYELLTADIGECRLAIWNKMFNAKEKYDSGIENLDCIIHNRD